MFVKMYVYIHLYQLYKNLEKIVIIVLIHLIAFKYKRAVYRL